MKCKICGRENGITYYFGKRCKSCGNLLVLELKSEEKKDET